MATKLEGDPPVVNFESDDDNESTVSASEIEPTLTEDEVKEFNEELQKMDKKISILCGGPFGVGKSTLLNGLMGVDKFTECETSSFRVGESLDPGTQKYPLLKTKFKLLFGILRGSKIARM